MLNISRHIVINNFYPFLLVLSLFVTLVLPQKSYCASWLQTGASSQMTGFNSEETTLTPDTLSKLTELWGIGCNDAGYSVISRSPAIANGRLYVSSAGSKLQCYNEQNGKLLWTYGKGNNAWANQPVLSGDGVVYYMEGSNPRNLYAVSADSGKQLWEAEIGMDLAFTDEVIPVCDTLNNLLYMISGDFGGSGMLYALDRKTGMVKWYKSMSKDSVGFVGEYVVLDDSANVYAKGHGNSPTNTDDGKSHILRINPKKQEIEVKYTLPDSAKFGGIENYLICKSTLVVQYGGNSQSQMILAAYNINQSAILWTKIYPRGQTTSTTKLMAANPVKGIIYLATDPYFYALDINTGNEIWKYTALGPVFNPTVANGVVYFLSSTNMYALRESTGEKLFTFPLGESAYPSTEVAICDGMLFFSGNGGTCDLFALGLGTQTAINKKNALSNFNKVDRNYWSLNNHDVSVYNILGKRLSDNSRSQLPKGVFILSKRVGNQVIGKSSYQQSK